jgi:hypothetical protein
MCSIEFIYADPSMAIMKSQISIKICTDPTALNGNTLYEQQLHFVPSLSEFISLHHIEFKKSIYTFGFYLPPSVSWIVSGLRWTLCPLPF